MAGIAPELRQRLSSRAVIARTSGRARQLRCYIPPDIVNQVLLRLPVKSLLRFRATCKVWLHLISDPRFVAAHHERSWRKPLILLHHRWEWETTSGIDLYRFSEDDRACHPLFREDLPADTDRKMKLYPYPCNGLVMLYSTGKNDVCICNPSTREFITLPKRSSYEYLPLCPGFGIDPLSSRFKLFWIFHEPCKLNWGCEIFTQGSDCWRAIDGPSNVCSIDCTWSPAPLNGIVYGLVKINRRSTWDILSFDLRDESFRALQVPDGTSDVKSCNPCLRVLEEELCFISLSDIWVFNEFECVWIKKYHIDNVDMVKENPVALHDGNFLLISYLEVGYRCVGSKLGYYNARSKMFRRLVCTTGDDDYDVPDVPYDWMKVQVKSLNGLVCFIATLYAESLVTIVTDQWPLPAER